MRKNSKAKSKRYEVYVPRYDKGKPMDPFAWGFNIEEHPSGFDVWVVRSPCCPSSSALLADNPYPKILSAPYSPQRSEWDSDEYRLPVNSIPSVAEAERIASDYAHQMTYIDGMISGQWECPEEKQRFEVESPTVPPFWVLFEKLPISELSYEQFSAVEDHLKSKMASHSLKSTKTPIH